MQQAPPIARFAANRGLPTNNPSGVMMRLQHFENSSNKLTGRAGEGGGRRCRGAVLAWTRMRRRDSPKMPRGALGADEDKR